MFSYDDVYEIRLANKDDIEAIMQFIEDNWKSGHILATNRSFFEYEFLEENGNDVNFILAIDKEKRSIESLCGILKANHCSDKLDIWGAIWKTLDNNVAFIGMELVERCQKMLNARSFGGVGENPKTTIPIMKMFKRYTAKMSHYYMLSEKISEFKIAVVEKKSEKSSVNKENNRIKEFYHIEDVINVFDFEKYSESIPYKDAWYINHRFFMHPVYSYRVYGIQNENNNVDALFVTREEKIEERTAVRLVDYIGSQKVFYNLGAFFENVLKQKGYEYVDFYCDGFEAEQIVNAGFKLLDQEDKNIIPNYFHPLVKENIDIWVSSTSCNSLFTKADSDQDRPN